MAKESIRKAKQNQIHQWLAMLSLVYGTGCAVTRKWFKENRE